MVYSISSFLAALTRKKQNKITTTRTRTCSYSSKIITLDTYIIEHGENQIQSLEPHFQTTAAISRSPKGTKTAVALPH